MEILFCFSTFYKENTSPKLEFEYHETLAISNTFRILAVINSVSQETGEYH